MYLLKYDHLAKWIILLLGGLLNTITCYSQGLSLKIAGNDERGYSVEVYKGEQKIVTSDGEFSLQMYNLDLSAKASLPEWKSDTWTGNENSITLKGETYISELDANLSVKVRYQVVNENVIKKTVELFQPSMPGMYYTLEQNSIPAKPPTQFVTFEHENFPGGFVHEIFPAVGFVTLGNDVVGFLTDAGYKNQYTRNTRRRFTGRGGGFVGMRRLADLNFALM
jgi:hypothetical protein